VNLDKTNNFSELISDTPVVYCYAKNLDSLNNQRNYINNFCKENMKNPTRFYIDYGVSNFLKNKKDLQELLSNNENIDILVFSIDRLTRDFDEMLSISSMCKDKNINIFGIKENELLLHDPTDKLILDFISKVKTNDKEDMEL